MRRNAGDERKRVERDRKWNGEKRKRDGHEKKKRNREKMDQREKAGKENQSPATSKTARSHRKCAAVTLKKIKRDAEADIEPEVDCSFFQPPSESSESSSDDEWIDRRPNGRGIRNFLLLHDSI